MNFDGPEIVLTMDVDWTPDFVLEDTLTLVREVEWSFTCPPVSPHRTWVGKWFMTPEFADRKRRYLRLSVRPGNAGPKEKKGGATIQEIRISRPAGANPARLMLSPAGR